MGLANWAPACWNLTNYVSEWYSAFFIIYKCFVGFSVVQVILSVFIQQTFKTASLDESIMINEKRNQAEAVIQNLKHLFETIDIDGDGYIDRGEFEEVLKDSIVKTWFSAIGIDVTDVNELFDMLANDDGNVDEDEFIGGVKSLRGLAKSTDVYLLKCQVKKMYGMVMDIHDSQIITSASGFKNEICPELK